ncbi:unnamed protein product [Clavelina lepadiformis]|uniref:Magnesium transporter n=1 Tax=Clavelina lepadiformis TaxID=159417 RepID=A0ABP0FN90_CLALP
MVYLTICNMVGALTVLCGKGLGISIKTLLAPSGIGVIFHPLFWVLVACQIVGIPVQIVYINKALALFETSAVTPIKYVFTNVFLIIGSILLFQESLGPKDFVGFACGFVTIVVGVVLLNSPKGNQSKAARYDVRDDDVEMDPLQ